MKTPRNKHMILFLLFFVGVARSNFPNTKIKYVVSGDTLCQPYFRNHDIDSVHNNIKYAIISLHGDGRNADEHFNILTQAATSAGLEDSTILLAPVYPYFEDLYEHNLGDDVLYWPDIDWNAGDLSRDTQSNPRPFRISSFSTMDTIYHRLVTNNPSLKKIVLTGHSAGSQMVVRYAAGGRALDALSGLGVDLVFVPTNTPSFLYYDDNRVLNQSAELFQFGPTSCGSASQYKYGLENLNQYMEETGESTIVGNYELADVTYLVGQYDFGGQTNTCARMVQGNSRLIRTHVYFSYIGFFYGESIYNNHRMAEIPSTYHEFEQVVFSDCGMSALFEVGDCELYVDGSQLINYPPIAIASEGEIVNPNHLVSLGGAESVDQDGEIQSYGWSQLAGPSVNIEFADSVYAHFIVPEESGSITVQLEVTDNEGARGRDTTNYIVNEPPTANAGEDQGVGVSSVVLLDGSLSIDTNENIESYNWTQIEGAPITIFSNNQVVATFYSPANSETLSFQISVVDELGLIDKDTTTVYVSSLAVTENHKTEKNQISLFPNPFNSSLFIGNLNAGGFEVIEVAIYNIAGKKIISWNLLNQNNKNLGVLWRGKDENGFEIKSGLYFVRFKGHKKTTTRKVTYLK